MVRALTLVIGALIALSGASRAEAPAPTPLEGLWLVQDRSAVIAIRPCADSPDLCGWIVGHYVEPGEPLPVDLDGQPQCGMALISRLREIVPGVWEGDIRNPRDGRVYSARLQIDEEGRLLLRGYVLVPLFGSTQVWTRWTGTVTPDCKMVPRP